MTVCELAVGQPDGLAVAHRHVRGTEVLPGGRIMFVLPHMLLLNAPPTNRAELSSFWTLFVYKEKIRMGQLFV